MARSADQREEDERRAQHRADDVAGGAPRHLADAAVADRDERERDGSRDSHRGGEHREEAGQGQQARQGLLAWLQRQRPEDERVAAIRRQ
jgi:hypothetical protein